jgi:polycystin 1L2
LLPIFCNWVLVAKRFSQPEHVLVYYSMPRTPWDNAHVLSCMSSLLKTPEKEMTYLVKTCQRQGNGFDCGVFAIDFATNLANGEDPATTLYDKKKLRSHLAKCMSAKKLTLFPFSIIRKTGSREIAEKVDVYCVCRRTEYQLFHLHLYPLKIGVFLAVRQGMQELVPSHVR